MHAFSRLFFAALLVAITIVPATAAEKIKVLIVDGQNNHAWAKTTPIIKDMLEKSGRFTVEVATTPPKNSPQEAWAQFCPEFKQYQAVLVNYNDYGKGDQWPAEVQKAMEDYMKSGGGLVLFHAANNAFPMWAEWNKMIGMNWQPNTYGDALKVVDGKVVRIPKGEGPGAGHGPQHEYDVELLDKDHPVTKGMPAKWHHVKDELYHGQRGPALNVHVLAYAFDDPATTQGKGTGNNEPLVYTVTYGPSRVFVNLMGHGPDQTGTPDMIALLTRGTEWAATGKVTLPLPEDFK